MELESRSFSSVLSSVFRHISLFNSSSISFQDSSFTAHAIIPILIATAFGAVIALAIWLFSWYWALSVFKAPPFISLMLGNVFPDFTLHKVIVYYRGVFPQYWPIARFHLMFFYPVLVPIDPEYVRILLGNTDVKDPEAYKPIEPWIGDGLIMSHGLSHVRKRKLLTPAFHFDVLRDYVHVFHRSARVLLRKLEQRSAASPLADGAFSLDIYPHITNLSLDNIMQCVFSKETNCQLLENACNSEEMDPYLRAVHEMTGVLMQRMTSLLLRADPIFHLTPQGFRFRRYVRIAHEASRRMIVARRATINQEEVRHSRGHLDFVDILLRCRDEAGNPMDDEEIIREANTFMFAGHDTTANGMTWLLVHLAANAEAQERCRDEITDLLAESDSECKDITYDQLMNKLPYLTACMRESLRLCPPVPWIGRRTSRDITLPDGRLVPCGTPIVVGITMLHFNPKLFPEPYVFRPERFLGAGESDRVPTSYIPFSYGARNCLGKVFAELEIKITVALLLRRVRMCISSAQELTFSHEIITRPRDGAHLVFRPLPSSN